MHPRLLRVLRLIRDAAAVHPEVFHQLQVDGWTTQQYHDWIEATLRAALVQD